MTDEVNGTWGDAIEVPGAPGLNTGGNAEVASVSCSSAGNCAAGGYYASGSQVRRAFVADEVNGIWGDAIQVPGASGYAVVTSVSCPSPGSCAAGGQYTASSSGGDQAFVVSQN